MLTQMLWKRVCEHPKKAAIVQGSRRISYEQLYVAAGQVSVGLRALGVEASDGVALVLPNCPEFIMSFFACARLGAVMLPLNPQYTRDELHRFIDDGQAQVIITDALRAPLCREVIATMGGDIRMVVVDGEVEGATHFEALMQSGAPEDSPGATSEALATSEMLDARACYLYTSGSTGEYKRLCCTQSNLYYEAHNFVETVGLTADDPILCTIPLYHSYGLGNCLLDAAYTGATLVLLEPVIENGVPIEAPFVSRCQRVLDLMGSEDIRFFPGVPYQFATLAALPDEVTADLSRIKWCISSGDVLPERTYNQFLARFGHPIRSLYGSTEAGSICMNAEPADRMTFGSLGRPLANVDLDIRDEKGRVLPDGQEGRMWVKSPVIPPSGYENRPELNPDVFQHGYYDTGDMGKKDVEGHVVMTGRKQSFVDVGGYKVDVGEVEEILHQHPQVREAAVLGVEMPPMGEVIKAAIVREGACEEADILEHCRKHLAVFKLPRLIEFRDELPRSPIGKVLKGELQGIPDSAMAFSTQASAPLTAALSALSSQANEQKVELLAQHLQAQVAATLQVEGGEVSRTASFQSLGVDSIRAAELQNRLIDLTGMPLSITLLWNHPSVDELASVLVSQMPGRDSASGLPNVTPTPETLMTDLPRPVSSPQTSLDALFGEIVGLSDDEVDAFFEGDGLS